VGSLIFDRLSYRYPEAQSCSIEDLSLEVASGQFLLVTGLSASGKSTLLRLACGLAPHFYGGEVFGKVEVSGKGTEAHTPSDLARYVGYVGQDPHTATVMNTVRAELSFPLENHGYQRLERVRGVEEVATALGIDHLLDRSIQTLSGGELQRVAIASALAPNPKILLLDEPTAQLDPAAKGDLLALLRRVNDEWGTTVVIAEHDISICIPHVDRVVVLENGFISADLSPQEFLVWAGREAQLLETQSAKLLRELGLSPPPTTVKAARLAISKSIYCEKLTISQERSLNVASSSSGEQVLEVDNLWYEIQRGPTVLQSVSLSLQAGQSVALVGRNGSGKSTLLKLLKGLIKPTKGSVKSSGEVALLLQNPSDYLIYEQVSQYANEQLLKHFSLDSLNSLNPKDLSRGQQQRLALAHVLSGCGQPVGVVALDEPTNGMDISDKQQLVAMVEGLKSESKAVVVATHDMEFAASFADRVLMLASGEIIADGSVEDLLSGGWYFTTEVARIVGSRPGPVTVEQALKCLEFEELPNLSLLKVKERVPS